MVWRRRRTRRHEAVAGYRITASFSGHARLSWTRIPASYMPWGVRPARPSSRRSGCALAKDMTVVAPACRIAGDAGAEGPRTTVWASEASARRRGMVLLTNAEPEMKT